MDKPQPRPQPKPGILEVAPYRAGFADAWPPAGGARMSLNEHALGPSPLAIAAYTAAAGRLGRYGDSEARELKASLTARFGMPPDQLVIGNGSEELLLLLAQGFLAPGDEGLFSAFGFLVYRIAIQAAGGVPVALPEPDLTVDVDAMLAAVSPRTKLVFLANPNNPTGTMLPAAAVRRLHAGLPPHVLLVVDAAYAEFVGDPDYADGAALVREHSNVLMLRTFSKAYGLAGARLGYAFGPAAVVDVIDRIRAPFNVSAATQAAGVAALSDTAHLAANVEHARVERVRLSAGLARLGWSPVPSVTNFVMAGTPGGVPAATAVQALAARGLLVRPLAGYGLHAHVRFTVGTAAENDALLQALALLRG